MTEASLKQKEMDAIRETIATLGKTGTATTAVGMHRMVANAPGRHPVVRNMTIVAPGRLLPSGKMIGGLQGTMIGEVAMMTEEALTLTMTVAGMITTDAGTTVAGTNGTIVSRTGRGTPTGITDGLAED